MHHQVIGLKNAEKVAVVDPSGPGTALPIGAQQRPRLRTRSSPAISVAMRSKTRILAYAASFSPAQSRRGRAVWHNQNNGENRDPAGSTGHKPGQRRWRRGLLSASILSETACAAPADELPADHKTGARSRFQIASRPHHLSRPVRDFDAAVQQCLERNIPADFASL